MTKASRIAVASTVGAGAFALSAAGAAAAATMVARAPLTPVASEPPLLTVQHADVHCVTLTASRSAEWPGVFGIRQQGGAVHARIGDIIAKPTPTTVVRRILAADTREHLAPGPAARNGLFWAGTPMHAHGMPFQDVTIDSPVGSMPSWLVPGAAPSAGGPDPARTWAITIHGHGSVRGEGLRVLPLLHALGLTTLMVSYRNDAGAAPSPDRLLHLGAQEWEDVDAAIAFALRHGARRILLIGFSMGGAIALRTSFFSEHRDVIDSLILDAPAVDWEVILEHHTRLRRVPQPLALAARSLMTHPRWSRSVRLLEPILLNEMTTDYAADALRHPTLLIHSREDEVVPYEPSRLLAHSRPDLVHLRTWDMASHTREWNLDPARWESQILTWIQQRSAGAGFPINRVDPSALPIRQPSAPAQPLSSGRRL
ncbi:alpha/beta hydrolase [Helcobacillus sp. ACRRO]|uniref:alpha/beta hydrolase family protein n=1 Tax=Helcobacillus sp. ACRRO TaxID=2918202 RepID=UPI001EF530C1|nr:alpha/beta fold hydrolase [Helcobacillus sp. ACRRO]MCG7426636.1 alpha/beta hydrolase [Helcobacillus sp. ACRRO]